MNSVAKVRVVAICIASTAGAPMQAVQKVEAIASAGLRGDRYTTSDGSFNKKSGSWWYSVPILGWVLTWFLQRTERQVTLIHATAFEGTGFGFLDSRRNLIVDGEIELMWLIGKKFWVGGVLLEGVKYCDPCNRPNKLLDKEESFKKAFFNQGGLIAKVVKGGIIELDDEVIPPLKGY